MVCASETFGANPDFNASFIMASVSDFHHSPEQNSIFETCQCKIQASIKMCVTNVFLLGFLI